MAGRIDPACSVATARGVLRRRSPGSVRIVGGAVQFFDRRAIRTSPVPPGGTEKRQLPLSQSTRPSLPIFRFYTASHSKVGFRAALVPGMWLRPHSARAVIAGPSDLPLAEAWRHATAGTG